MKTINTHITISRPQGNGCNYVSVTISDKDSGIRIIETRIKYKEFTEALTGLAHVDCEASVFNAYKNAGKKKETKPAMVPSKIFKGEYDKTIKRIHLDKYLDLKNILTDGWMLWSDGLSTQQPNNRTHDIILYRYKDKP